MDLFKRWRKPPAPVIDLEVLTQKIEKRLSGQFEEMRKGYEEKIAELTPRAEIAPETPIEEVPETPPDTEPVLVIQITCQTKTDGGLEAIYNVESNDLGIQAIDRAYAEMPKWDRTLTNQEKVILFLYDAISTLAEPLLPDATVTELDLRREVFAAPVGNQKWVTDNVDIATRGE